MTVGLLTAVVLLGIALPHAIDLRRVTPGTAVALWGSGLGLRAIAALFLAMYVVLYLPATGAFETVSQWCWHAILPFADDHGGFGAHRSGDALVALPAMLLVASVVSSAAGVARASRAVRRVVDRDAVGLGPRDSVIVPERSIVLAAAGLSRPRVLVSVGALTTLDDDELAAGLEHEHGHIARHHRWVLLYAESCLALARCQPGTRRAVRELAFHLERDADAWALARRHDRLALAGAICKSALDTGGVQPARTPLSGRGDAERRIDILLGGGSALCRARTGTVRLLAVASAALTIALIGSAPPTIAAGVAPLDAVVADYCVH